MSSNWGRPRANSRTAASMRAIHCVARGAAALLGQQTFEALFAELARLGIFGFGDAIGIEEENVSRAQFAPMHRHLHGIEQADRQAAGWQRFNPAARRDG